MTTDPSTPAARNDWEARLEQAVAFVASNGRLPRAKCADDAERSLGGWMTHQRRKSDRAKGYSPLTAGQLSALNSRLPGWRGRKASPKASFEQRLAEVKTYCDAYGKWPSYRSRDPQVRVLATWVNMQRHQGRLTEAQRKLLDEQLPGWSERPEQAWFRIADDVAAFRDRVGEWPSYGSREESVRRLAKWLLDQRTGRNVSEERLAYLEKNLPGWRVGVGQGNRPVEIWSEGLASVEAFRKTHGRFPRPGVSSIIERRAGGWLYQQLRDATMSAARRRIMDERIPGWDAIDVVSIEEWREAQKASWDAKFDDVVRFVSQHGRAPFASDDPALYGWLLRLRKRTLKLSPERQSLLDARLPGWRGLPSEIRRPVRAA